MKLVNNWRECKKWLSLHCMVIAGAIQGAWIYIPDDMKQTIPRDLVTGTTITLLLLGVVGRFINQSK